MCLISVPPQRHFLPLAGVNNEAFPWNVSIVSAKQNFMTLCIYKCNLLLLHRPHNKEHTQILRKAPSVVTNTQVGTDVTATEHSSLHVLCSQRLAVAATSPTTMRVVLYYLLCQGLNDRATVETRQLRLHDDTISSSCYYTAVQNEHTAAGLCSRCNCGLNIPGFDSRYT